EQIALRKANAYNTAPKTSNEAINSCLMYENEKFRYSSLNLQYWMLTARLIQNVGIGSDLWGYKTKGLKLSTVMMGHMGKYSNRKSTLEYIINNSNINGVRDYNLDEANINEKDDEDGMKTETVDSSGDSVTPQMSSLSFTENDVFILKPLISIAQAAHESDDKRLGIRHEHGDEHDYFQQYIKNFDDKMKLMNENLESVGHKDERKILDNTLGIGKESRERGIPPFWMFGVA
ncbi:13288_t:CDS:1, partial [Acaulospora morrowiae]